MEKAFQILNSVEFSRWNDTVCTFKTLRSKQYNKVCLAICKSSKFKDTVDGTEKEWNTNIVFSLKSSEELLAILPKIIQEAQNCNGVYENLLIAR